MDGLIDISRALPRLPLPLREAVLLVAVLGLGATEASRRAGVPRTTLHDRYRRGLEHLTTTLNGGRTAQVQTGRR